MYGVSVLQETAMEKYFSLYKFDHFKLGNFEKGCNQNTLGLAFQLFQN
jgi:hypothetical protein